MMISQAYQDRFSGVSRVYGGHARERFINAHVCVIGIGGVGSWSAEALARSGVAEITLVDLDELCITNMNRQIHALTSTIGQSKVEAMCQRILEINPEAIVHPISQFFTEKTAELILGSLQSPSPFDVVIDAIDGTSRKVQLIEACKARALPLVVCGAAGGRRLPHLARVADLSQSTHDPLLRGVKRGLRKNTPELTVKPIWDIPAIFSTEEPRPTQGCDSGNSDQESSSSRCETSYGSLTAVTGTFGLIAASVALELLISSHEQTS